MFLRNLDVFGRKKKSKLLLVGGANGRPTVLTLNLGEESVPSVTSRGDDLREREHIGEVWFALIGKLKLKMKTFNER